KNGGVVMVTFVPAFLSNEVAQYEEREEEESKRITMEVADTAEVRRRMEAWTAANPRPQATLAQVADHIGHVREVAGVDHVGLGSDFDGISHVPVGLEDVSSFPRLFAELIRRGWSDDDLRKLAGRNLLRVKRAAEGTAERLRKERQPSTMTIGPVAQPMSP
ncbi:MAG TPA: membrane dipeptidase, partial [Gemmatimonadales bacterium]|nr:membrane dipeptidase [Gemmatimonadales bacterium]